MADCTAWLKVKCQVEIFGKLNRKKDRMMKRYTCATSTEVPSLTRNSGSFFSKFLNDDSRRSTSSSVTNPVPRIKEND